MMDKIKVLVVGSGGREHALVWKIAQSLLVGRIYAAPGNDGMANLARCIPVQATDVDGLLAFARQEGIGLTIVGPEDPLAAGIVDVFKKAGRLIFGPTQDAARIETDKGWALALMRECGVPTGWAYAFSSATAVSRCAQNKGFPVVIKNPYLARGKGSFVCMSGDDVRQALAQIERQQHRRNLGRFVVMEYLPGEEVSVTAITDGTDVVYLVPAQDHKRLNEDDQGPMTGGMGAIAPVPMFTPELAGRVDREIVRPILRALAANGCPYQGVLYAGIVVTPDGPKVLEFNCRLGDPEAQVILPLLKTDLVELILAVCEGRLNKVSVELYDGRAAACVVLAAEGYGTPEGPKTGDVISGLYIFPTRDFCFFHAGTKRLGGDVYATNVGRVLGATGWGEDLPAALASAYRAVGQVRFHGMQYRRDIGQKALRYLAAQK